MDCISIRGARTHNLQNIDVDLPRNKLIVITGLSGSGKSSLAFDTIYAEGQRRYVESLSSYARQFLSVMEKPDVDHIDGLSPAISIEQKSTSHNPRSTVGTVTEIYDYLRLLYARVGEPRCPHHNVVLHGQTISQMVDHVLELPDQTRAMLLAPVIKDRKGEHKEIISDLRAKGYIRARIDGKVTELDQCPALDLRKKHSIEVIVDRIKIRSGINQRLTESFETALDLSDGIAMLSFLDSSKNHQDLVYSSKFACATCGYSITELEPRLFSFNNPVGACSTCDGLGVTQYFDPRRVVPNPELSLYSGSLRGWDRRNSYYFQLLESLAKHYEFDLDTPFEKLSKKVRDVILYGSGDESIKFSYSSERKKKVSRKHPFEGVIPNMERRYKETESNLVREELSKYISSHICPDCKGTRLTEAARNVFINNYAINQVVALPIGKSQDFFDQLNLDGKRGKIAEKIVSEISQRLKFLVNVGLDYLTLGRSAETLSGGEAQRIRLASQIGAGLVGVLYVLDEPSIGLHQRDNQRLLNTLTYLRDLGNTVIVVEHDEEAILNADHVVDIGPGAGVHGGHIVAQGTPSEIKSNSTSLTGQYLSGYKSIAIPTQRTPFDPKRLFKLKGACSNNLKKIDVEIPIGLMTTITGVSGSGKSTLVNDTLYRVVARKINNANVEPAAHSAITGLEHFDKVVNIDQSPIGRTPRSNPATYTGLFTPMRELFSSVPEARARGYQPGRFSFNVRGGRCEACQGDGVIKVEMHFLPDVYVVCDVCNSKRYNRETLQIHFKGKSIHDVLDMTVEVANSFFAAIPTISRKLQALMNVGLSYIKLGQRATTLSGGEAQRIKLARELSKRDTGSTLYILDEPTSGLHFHDINQLLIVLHRLRDQGNTIVVIEHNLDVIKTADWVIDLGPDGGDLGGEIVAVGTPEEVAMESTSYTGQFLKPILLPYESKQTMAKA